MIINTAQDVALVDCCGCLPDLCEAPRKECQSIFFSGLCGFEFPQLECTEDSGLRGKFFGSQSVVTTTSASYGEGTTYSLDKTVTQTTKREVRNGVCVSNVTEFSSESTETVTSENGSRTIVSTGTFNDDDDSFDWIITTTVTAYGVTTVTTEDGSYSVSGASDFIINGPDWSCNGSEFTRTDVIGNFTYGYTVTFADQLADDFIKIQLMALSFDDNVSGYLCSSNVIIQYFCDPPEGTEDNSICSRIIAGNRARYRMGIPCGDRWEATTTEWGDWNDAEPEDRGPEPIKTCHGVAHAAWVIAHAAWEAANPTTRGDEPIEPTPRSTYELQWDEVFFPEGYGATINDPDATPPDPLPENGWVHPQIPDPDAPSPSLVASRSWTYSGNEYSEWFEIPVPDIEGQTRVVNMMIICYRSAALGQKPTAYGEVYEL